MIAMLSRKPAALESTQMTSRAPIMLKTYETIRILAVGAVVAAALGTVGCASPDVESIVTAPLAVPIGGAIGPDAITIPHRRALGFVAQPMNGDETLKERITLAPDDPAVVSFRPTEEMNQFVAVGLLVGTTIVRVQDSSGFITDVTMSVEVVSP